MIEFSMLSKSGDRENNEDCIGMYQDKDRFCFVLADGLGGHGKGEIASRVAVDSVIETFVQEKGKESFMDQAFITAQNRITEKQNMDRLCADMKTTLVVLDLEENNLQWGHIGDSRLYYFQDHRLLERTLDHSVPQMLVTIGKIKEKEIRHHPDRNRLLRVLGTEMEEQRHQKSEWQEKKNHQAFLLCSDGFWELINEKKMEWCLRWAKSPEQWLSDMEKIILKNGRNTNMDNYSAIAVWINQDN